MLVITIPAWCQSDGSANADKEATKQAAKAQKKALKVAERAIKTGDIEQLKAVLQANPGLVSSDVPQGVVEAMVAAPLATIAAGGMLRGTQLVYAAGQGVTLLYWAVSYERKDAVELLLSYHADINAQDGLGYTPLHEAVDVYSPELVRLLIDHGADVNRRARNGDTPLGLLRYKQMAGTLRRYQQPMRDIEAILLQHGAQ
jgi:hypothetical protein